MHGLSLFSSDRYRQVVLADEPLLYWRCNETSGTTAVDESGQGSNGTISGFVTHAQAGALKGNANKSMVVAAGGHFAYFTQSAFRFTNGTPFSVEFWMSSGPANWIPFSNVNASASYQGYDAYCHSTTTFQFGVYNAYPTSYSIRVWNAGMNYLDSNWHHVVVTYTGSGGVANMACYVDGAACSVFGDIADTIGSNDFAASAVHLHFGCRPDGTLPAPSGSRMDECAIYDYVLPASRVAVHYNAGKNGA